MRNRWRCSSRRLVVVVYGGLWQYIAISIIGNATSAEYSMSHEIRVKIIIINKDTNDNYDHKKWYPNSTPIRSFLPLVSSDLVFSSLFWLSSFPLIYRLLYAFVYYILYSCSAYLAFREGNAKNKYDGVVTLALSSLERNALSWHSRKALEGAGYMARDKQLIVNLTEPRPSEEMLRLRAIFGL